MNKARLVLGMALLLAVCAFIGLSLIPFESWVWASRGGMVLIGLLGIALVLLLITTLFRVDNDLWDTTYFRYMRAFWGTSLWGGETSPLKISVCRATWLSFLAFLCWLPMVTFFIFSAYWAFISLVNGLFYITFDKEPSIFGQITNLFLGELLLLMFGCVFMLINLWRDSINSAFKKNGIRNFIFWFMLCLSSIEFAVILIAVPVRAVGPGEFILWLATGMAGVVILAVAAGVVFGFGWLITRMSKSISEHTVPVVLAKEQWKGWKEKICPFIVQE